MSTPCGPTDRAGDDGDGHDRWAVYFRDPRRRRSVWRVLSRHANQAEARAAVLTLMDRHTGDWWVADTTLGKEEPDIGQGRRARTGGYDR